MGWGQGEAGYPEPSLEGARGAKGAAWYPLQACGPRSSDLAGKDVARQVFHGVGASGPVRTGLALPPAITDLTTTTGPLQGHGQEDAGC